MDLLLGGIQTDPIRFGIGSVFGDFGAKIVDTLGLTGALALPHNPSVPGSNPGGPTISTLLSST